MSDTINNIVLNKLDKTQYDKAIEIFNKKKEYNKKYYQEQKIKNGKLTNLTPGRKESQFIIEDNFDNKDIESFNKKKENNKKYYLTRKINKDKLINLPPGRKEIQFIDEDKAIHILDSYKKNNQKKNDNIKYIQNQINLLQNKLKILQNNYSNSL